MSGRRRLGEEAARGLLLGQSLGLAEGGGEGGGRARE